MRSVRKPFGLRRMRSIVSLRCPPFCFALLRPSSSSFVLVVLASRLSQRAAPTVSISLERVHGLLPSFSNLFLYPLCAMVRPTYHQGALSGGGRHSVVPIIRGRLWALSGGGRPLLFLSSGGAFFGGAVWWREAVGCSYHQGAPFGRCLVAGGLCCSYHQGAPSWLVRLGRIIVAGWGRSGRCAMEVRRFAAGRTRCVWRLHASMPLFTCTYYVRLSSFLRPLTSRIFLCARHRATASTLIGAYHVGTLERPERVPRKRRIEAGAVCSGGYRTSRWRRLFIFLPPTLLMPRRQDGSASRSSNAREQNRRWTCANNPQLRSSAC